MNKKIRKNPNRAAAHKAKRKAKKTKIVLLVTLGVLLVAVALGALFVFLHIRYNGWKNVTPTTEQGSYSQEIELRYLLGEKGRNGKADLKDIQSILTRTLVESYQLFSDSESFDGVVNLKTLSSGCNNSYTVSPLLYETLKTMTENENRILYYAPVLSIYEAVFASSTDSCAKESDPRYNADKKRVIERLLPYIMSEEHIRIEFLEDEDCLLTLFVSDDYLAELSYFGIENILSLGVFELAFVVDYVADTLQKAGYTNGVVSSYNGYVRNLGLYDEAITTDIYVKSASGEGEAIGEFSYKGARSLVAFHNYPLSNQAKRDFYIYEDGSTVSPYLNLITGLCEAPALDEMLFYAKDIGCAKLALMTYSYFVNSALMGNDINNLTAFGIYALYTLDGSVFYNDVPLISDADLKLVKSGYMKSYLYN